ncbi:MAG: sulfatase-like hydrolase/transferase [Pirellulales bacterium]
MNIRFASMALFCLTVTLSLVSNANAAKQPNIIFILVDDLGYGDIGCFWQDQKTGTQKFDTPGIDQMAAEGMKLTHHYISAPVCAPSRGSFLQGRHQGHCDIRDSQFDKPLPPNHTISSVLKQAGYYTVHVGKDGLAGQEPSVELSGNGSKNLESHPLSRGFDRFFGYLFHADGHEHYPQNGTTNKKAYIYDDYRQVTDAHVDLYSTDAWTAFAKHTIIEETINHPDRPFFIYLAYDTPHFKMQNPPLPYPKGLGLNGGLKWTGAPAYCNTAINKLENIDSVPHASVNPAWPESNQKHVSMVRRIDDSVADIMQTLKDMKIDDNTLVVFTSDNGPHNEGNNPRFFESYANMEGIKRDIWEAGIRTPTIAWWPKSIQADSTSAFPCASWDWLSTFVDLAGTTRPAFADGNSVVPTLTGQGTQRDKGYLYFEFGIRGNTPKWDEFPSHRGAAHGQMQALRIGDFMGVRTDTKTAADDFQIYNVVTDPAQSVDLAEKMPELQQTLKAKALQVRRPGGGIKRPYGEALVPAVEAEATSGVLNFAAFEGNWNCVPEFTDIIGSATAVGQSKGIDLSVSTREQNTGVLYQGYFQAPTDGAYTFSVKSDSGASVRIHDAHLIDDDFNHTGEEVSGSIHLKPGLHPIRIYYRHIKGKSKLELQYSGPGIEKQTVPVTAFAAETLPKS